MLRNPEEIGNSGITNLPIAFLRQRNRIDRAANAAGQMQRGDDEQGFVGFVGCHLVEVEVFEQIEPEVADGDHVHGQVGGRHACEDLDSLIVGTDGDDIVLL